MMTKIIDALKQGSGRLRLRVPIVPFLWTYEVNMNDLVDSSNVDERIAKLGEIKRDLEAAAVAVDSLQSEAEARKIEASRLRETVDRLSEDRTTAEALLKLPEESFTRLLTKAGSKGRWRGLFEGAVVGFVTGVISSFVVWYFTGN